MKLELKNIEVNLGMSEETYCYSASLWVDGRKVGSVGNHGQGGCDLQHVERAMLAAVNAWLANNEEPTVIGDISVLCDLETWCSDQIGDYLLERDLSTAMRRKVLFVKDSKVFEISKGKHQVDALVTHIRDKHGAETPVLNVMERQAALALYKLAVAA